MNMSHVSLTKSILVGITDHQGVVANFQSIPKSTYINHQQVGVSLWIGWKGVISWEKKIFMSYRFFLKPIHWVSKNATPPFHLMIWFQPGSFGTHRGPRGPRGCHVAGNGEDSLIHKCVMCFLGFIEVIICIFCDKSVISMSSKSGYWSIVWFRGFGTATFRSPQLPHFFLQQRSSELKIDQFNTYSIQKSMFKSHNHHINPMIFQWYSHDIPI